MTPSPAVLAPPEPTATIAVILGAGDYPQKPVWSNPVLGASARAFRDYLLSASGLGLTRAQVLDLFDSEADPTTQLLRIGDFLATSTGTARDLILYYVGHGGFHNDEYHLGIRCTQNHREFITTIESKKLAQLIREEFGRKRVYVILDSCFSASAANDFQADEIVAAARKMGRPLPRQGTAFLAAASRDNVTRAPRGERYTVFTGAMLEALARGIDNAQPRISIYELYDEVREILQRREIDDESRPELHLPNQADGDVSRLQVFPNAAHLRAEEQRLQAERAREDADARARAAAAAQARLTSAERAAAAAQEQLTAAERAAAMARAELAAAERAAAMCQAELTAAERVTTPALPPSPEVNRRQPVDGWTICLIVLGVLLLVLIGWGAFGSPERSSHNEAVGMMKQYMTDLCACKDHDTDCGKHAGDEYQKAMTDWSAKLAGKKADTNKKPDPEMEKLTDEILDCSKRVMTPDMGAAGAAAGPPAAGAAAGPPTPGTD